MTFLPCETKETFSRTASESGHGFAGPENQPTNDICKPELVITTARPGPPPALLPEQKRKFCLGR